MRRGVRAEANEKPIASRFFCDLFFRGARPRLDGDRHESLSRGRQQAPTKMFSVERESSHPPRYHSRKVDAAGVTIAPSLQPADLCDTMRHTANEGRQACQSESELGPPARARRKRPGSLITRIRKTTGTSSTSTARMMPSTTTRPCG